MSVISYTYKSPKEAFEKVMDKPWTDAFKMADTVSKVLLVAGFILPWVFILFSPISSLLAPTLVDALNRELFMGLVGQIAMIALAICGFKLGKVYALREVTKITCKTLSLYHFLPLGAQRTSLRGLL